MLCSPSLQRLGLAHMGLSCEQYLSDALPHVMNGSYGWQWDSNTITIESHSRSCVYFMFSGSATVTVVCYLGPLQNTLEAEAVIAGLRWADCLRRETCQANRTAWTGVVAIAFTLRQQQLCQWYRTGVIRLYAAGISCLCVIGRLRS